MKLVPVLYWNSGMNQMEQTILQEPEPINLFECVVSFQWVPNTQPGHIPELENYKLNTFISLNINEFNYKCNRTKLKFNVIEEMVKEIKNRCSEKGIIIDPDYLTIFNSVGD